MASQTITALGNAIINLIKRRTPIATANTVGMVKPDGSTIKIDANGVISSNGGGGSGLEVCDIGMALYVDETKGLRRYLNGQIVDINTNTQAFLNRLKQITTLHPSLLCTEDEWQSAKTMSAFGQVGKFVFNYSGDVIVSVRLPRVVNVQGLFDLQNLGMTVEAGLPTHTHTRGTMNITGGCFIEAVHSGFYGALYDNGGSSTYMGNNPHNANGNIGFDASRSWTGSTSAPDNSIYGSSTTVQQEAIQYPYFIQIATGQETENNIINDIELNNPYVFGKSEYSKTPKDNLSWLASKGQWNPKGSYPSYYDWILENVNNGTEDFKLSTDTYDDYSWVINTADETFRLPLLDGSESLIGTTEIRFDSYATSNTFNYTAPQNGHINIIFSCGEVGDWISIHNETAGSTHIVRGSYINAWENVSMDVKRGDVLKIECDNTAKDKGFFFYPFVGNGSLYYYVGETVQNANLIDAGRIGEILPTKVSKSGDTMTGGLQIDVPPVNDSTTPLILYQQKASDFGGVTFSNIMFKNSADEEIGVVGGVENTDGSHRIRLVIKNGSNWVEMPQIIDSYRNGKSGYNIWSNGYCEQWGWIGGGTGTSSVRYNFLKPFANDNFNITYSVASNENHTRWVSQMSLNGWDVNGFNAMNVGGFGAYWCARGYV